MNHNRDKLSLQKHVCLIQLQNILTVSKQFLFIEKSYYSEVYVKFYLRYFGNWFYVKSIIYRSL